MHSNVEPSPHIPADSSGPMHEVAQYLTAAETDIPAPIHQVASHIVADPGLVQPALEAAGGLHNDTAISRLGTLIGEAHILRGSMLQRFEQPSQPYRPVSEEDYNKTMRIRRKGV